MANTKLATPEEMKAQMLVEALRAIQNAKTAKESDAAYKSLQKASRSIGLTDAQTDALGKLVAQPGELGALSIQTINAFADKKGTQLIDLQRKWSDAYMRQGDSVANIAGVGRMLASIASFCGAEDIATMLHEKADAEMVKAERHYAMARDKMKQDVDTSGLVTQAIRDGVKVLTDKTPGSDLSAATAALTKRGTDTDIAPVYAPGSGAAPAAQTPPAAAAAQQKITWQQFQENMESVGVSKTGQEQMRKLFDKTSSFDDKSAPTAVDTTAEANKLIAGIKKADSLTPTQKTELSSKLHIAAPELVPA